MEKSLKRNLLSDDLQLRYDTVHNIHQRLVRSTTDDQRLEFVNTLIRWDIAMILCDLLAVNDSHILRVTLSCLRFISESELFYTNNVAIQAICQILQNAYLIAQKSTEERKALKMMAITLRVFVTRADSFKINLNGICKMHQLLEFINNLDVENSTNTTVVLVVLNLYAVVLPHVDNLGDEEMSSLVVKIYKEVLTAAKRDALIYVQNNDPMLITIIGSVVAICDAGLKLCEIHHRSPSTSPEYSINASDREPACSKTIVDITCKILLETVIPNAKIIYGDDRNHITEAVAHFANCLCQLYKRRDVDIDAISNQLLIQGYLKYLHHIMDYVESERELICDCIASILTDLTQNNLMMDKWSDGPQGFRRFIKAGLSTYSKSNAVDISTPAVDVVLFLCYFHYLATRDPEVMDIIKAIPLSLKLKHLSVDNLPEIPTFQVIWLLFAMMALEDPSAMKCSNFSHALLRIIGIVEKIGVENCYTHHPALPCFVLQNSVFPNKIRNGVVELWLKYEDKVHHLVPLERMQILIDSLLVKNSFDIHIENSMEKLYSASVKYSNFLPAFIEFYIKNDIIRTGTEDVVERASNELLRMIGDTGDSTSLIEQQITGIMWEKLPEVLIDFSSDRGGGIGGYLKMLNRLSCSGVSILVAIRSSNNLISTLDREDLEISRDVQMLLVKLISKMLSVAFAAQDGRVVSLYMNDDKILEKLWARAFSKEHDNLSAACYRCLTDILLSQKQFSIKCQKPVSMRPIDLFKALFRKPHVYFDVMGFLNQIWVGGIDNPAISCPTCTDREAKEILTGIYRTYIRIHLNAPPSRWEVTFQYLTNLLKFFRGNYDVVLFDCCDYICNHSVISMAISCSYSGGFFIKFVSTWLILGLYSRCSHVVHALESKSLRDKGMEEKILFRSTFDEAIQELKVWIEKLVAAEQWREDNVKELKATLAKFI